MSTKKSLPAPLVPADADLGDALIPRERFAQLAVLAFNISIEEARSHVNRIADELEVQQARRRRQ